MYSMSEDQLQENIADFLVLQYPDVQFHSDYGSGTHLSKKQSAEQKRQNGGRRGWPDMTIAKARMVQDYWFHSFKTRQEIQDIEAKGEPMIRADLDFSMAHGLYLELKKDGVRLKKKNGEWADKHIAEQAAVLDQLRADGYAAEFAVGFDQAVHFIKAYLGEPHKQKVEF